jgi:histidine triad (HIT) family protein
MTDSCIFCKIIAGSIPGKKIYEDDLVVALEDIAPAAPRHILLLPRRHIASLLALTPADDLLVGHIHRVAAQLAHQLGFAESGFRLVVNTNDDGGQTVFHLHFHLLAGRRLTWPPG